MKFLVSVPLILFCMFSVVTSTSCDQHLGMSYQHVALKIPAKDSVYCYCFYWGMDAWCYFLSSKKEVCKGLDSLSDIAIGMGDHVIFYRWEGDSLSLYVNAGVVIPKTFPVPIKLTYFDNISYSKYQEEYQRKRLMKVIFDSPSVELPCPMIYDKEGKRLYPDPASWSKGT